MGTSVLMITKHYSHLTPLMKAKQFAGDIDDSGPSKDTEHIRALMNAQLAAKNIMSLVEASTGMSFSIQKMAPELADDLTHRLSERLKTVQ
jgi:flagellar motility protein MotE (MotC chaperone)